jgi:hypothetical protein
MFRVINLCEGSDDKGELSNTNINTIAASASPFLVSRKRPRENEELSKNDAHHPSNEKNPGNRNDGFANKHSQNPSSSEPPSNVSGRQSKVSPWEVRLSELADYRRIHGHCNVPTRSDSENTKLATWVTNQRQQYKLHRQGEISFMTNFRIQALEKIAFEWSNTWEARLSELADYRKIHGHCNIPASYSENAKLGKWVTNQRSQYKLHLQGERSYMTLLRIQALESLGFEWDSHSVAWVDRLNELADYRKSHGHCNVPRNYSENSKLGQWVTNQRSQYKSHQEGKASSMTTFRIQALESLGFEWNRFGATWEDRLSELADYRRIHGHCTVPYNYSENRKLATWVMKQRSQYKSHQEGKTSPITTFRIQELERLGFEWKSSRGYRKRTPKKPSLDDNTTRVRERVAEAPERVQTTAQTQEDFNIAAAEAASYPMNTDSGQTTQDDRSTNKHSQKRSTLEPPSKVSRRQSKVSAWEDRFSELADYRKIHGHCNVPTKWSENAMLGAWVTNQRSHYRLHQEGKTSPMTTFRIQELESVGFKWSIVCVTAWEVRLSELAEYRKIYGHCNVPQNYSENTKLAAWVQKQRSQYKSHQEGKASSVTNLRIQALESLGFEWNRFGATWGDCLSELADYRRIHGHCTVPYNYSENRKLATWVATQRNKYNSNLNGKTSPMTTFRIQELERLGFEWKSSRGYKKRTPKKPIVDDDATCVRERAVEAPERVQTTAQTQKDFSSGEIRSNQVNVACEPE